MRPFALSLTIAAVALGGVALAQPVGVVDPWERPSSDADSWFAPSAETRAESLPVESVLKDPWAPATAAKAPPPPVSPVGAVDVPVDLAPMERASALPSLEPVILDPWAPSVASELPSLAHDLKPLAVADRAASTRWSARTEELVDPWQRVPDLTAPDRIRLVVDPWAR